jgi:hypothetical protein
MDLSSQAFPVSTSRVDDVPDVVVDHPQGKAKAKAKSRQKPRIDIDNQITEANRLSGVLRRVAQAAKTAAKNGTRTKRRLVMKAGKLSSEDLERIAVLKRCGLFNGGIQDVPPHTDAPSASSTSSTVPDKDCLFVHAKIAGVMNNIPGASGLFRTFEQGRLLSEAPFEPDSPSLPIGGMNSGAIAAGGGSVIVAQPLPLAGALPLLAQTSCVQASSLNNLGHVSLKRSPSQGLMDDDEHEG